MTAGNMGAWSAWLLASLLALPSAAAEAAEAAEATQQLDTRVVGVADGDTITVLDGGRTRRIRLAGIDAPEHSQPFSEKSRQALADRVFGRQVRIQWSKLDQYGRPVAKVLLVQDGDCATPCEPSLDVNLAQVTDGMAWHYRQYAREQAPADRTAYAAAEAQARERGAGLWADADPVAPWNWRHGTGSSAAASDPASSDAPVRKSRAGICHEPGSPNYGAMRGYTSYATVAACIADGGRLPRGN